MDGALESTYRFGVVEYWIFIPIQGNLDYNSINIDLPRLY